MSHEDEALEGPLRGRTFVESRAGAEAIVLELERASAVLSATTGSPVSRLRKNTDSVCDTLNPKPATFPYKPQPINPISPKSSLSLTQPYGVSPRCARWKTARWV